MKRYQVIPVGESDGSVDVAMADPTDTDTLQALELALGRRVRSLVALGADIQSAVRALWGSDGGNLTVESVTQAADDALA